MTEQPSLDALQQQRDREQRNLARIEASLNQWERAGRLIYKMHAHGVTSIDPADVITQSEETNT